MRKNGLFILYTISLIISIVVCGTTVKTAIDISRMHKELKEDLDNLNTEFDRYCENLVDLNVELQYIEDRLDEYDRKVAIANESDGLEDIGISSADTEYLTNVRFLDRAVDSCYYNFTDGSVRSYGYEEGDSILIGIYSDLLEKWADRKYPVTDDFFICLSYKYNDGTDTRDDTRIETRILSYGDFVELINSGTYNGHTINIDHMDLIKKIPRKCTTKELMDDTLIAIELVVYVEK